MNYVEIGKHEVMECIGEGHKVFICDFDTLRLMNCSNMSISAVISFMNKANTKFYLGVTDE